MRNDFEVRGDVTAIFMNLKGKVLECIIDTSDILRLLMKRGRIFPTWNKDTESYYANLRWKESGKLHGISVHRFLMIAPKGMVVDHINNDTLDNRLCNLRLVTPSENNQNRKLPTETNNKSGYRGVNWHSGMKKWRARVIVGKEEVYVDYFDDVHEAGKAVAEARKKYMPYSKEARRGGNDK
jgi:hypothetical protein